MLLEYARNVAARANEYDMRRIRKKQTTLEKLFVPECRPDV
jgi:hypothetical protein